MHQLWDSWCSDVVYFFVALANELLCVAVLCILPQTIHIYYWNSLVLLIFDVLFTPYLTNIILIVYELVITVAVLFVNNLLGYLVITDVVFIDGVLVITVVDVSSLITYLVLIVNDITIAMLMQPLKVSFS